MKTWIFAHPYITLGIGVAIVAIIVAIVKSNNAPAAPVAPVVPAGNTNTNLGPSSSPIGRTNIMTPSMNMSSSPSMAGGGAGSGGAGQRVNHVKS